MGENLTNAKLAELSLNATLLQIAPGGEYAGKVTVEDCAKKLHGEEADNLVKSIHVEFGTSVLAGESTISQFLNRDGVSFEGGRTNVNRLKAELISMWDNFASLSKATQEAHTNALLAWVAGEGEYPSLP